MSTLNVIFFGHFCNFSQSELFYLCHFHSDMAICRPTLFLLTMKEILLVHFIITNFRVALKMLCTPWLRNPLTISRLFTSAANRPWRQFFSRFVKVRFRILDIQFFPPRVVKILSGTILCVHGYNNKCRFLIGYRFMNALFHNKYRVVPI
jgi:hypothetical protein